MLQVVTGKFFRTSSFHVTNHAFPLYSNLQLSREIVTACGRLRTVATTVTGSELVYEVQERLETTMRDGAHSIIISAGHPHLRDDFAALVAFYFEGIVVADAGRLHALLNASPNPTTRLTPKDLIHPHFLASRQVSDTQIEAFEAFTSALLQLSRDTYEGIMRAVKRLTTGICGVAEDLDVSYTLLVATIESLAQKFDEFTPTWKDFDQRKRARIDKALNGTDLSTADEVRAAILYGEHVALARRFREFAVANTCDSFYREEAIGRPRPVRKLDLPQALEQAYRHRSTYVHELSKIPDVMRLAANSGDYIEHDRRIVLTASGVARVARHVISTFTHRGEATGHEDFDYLLHLPSVAYLPVMAKYWIHQAQGFTAQSARNYLSGFLEHLVDVRLGRESHLTSMQNVLIAIESLAISCGPAQRVPMLAIYLLWHLHIVDAGKRPNWASLIEAYQGDLSSPIIDGIPIALFSDWGRAWSSSEFRSTIDEYLAQRSHKGGLRMPPLLETAMLLYYAELLRLEGRRADSFRALREAVAAMPGHSQLLAFEGRCSPLLLPPIEWWRLLLP